ncbi:MAG: T9SS type A sorting domain-containing protein [Bacteroidota bacterium]
MKAKSFLMLVVATAMYASSWAQCSTSPMFLNSAYETNNGFSCNFFIQQPICDTFDGIQLQWKGATDPSWNGFTIDSNFQSGSDVVYGFGIGTFLNVGIKYQWRVRMITYKHNGKPSYSPWTMGKNFTPIVLAGSGCTYPGPLCLFQPYDTGAFLLFSNDAPSGWEYPTKSKLQYKVDATTGWTTINNIDATSGYFYLDNLNPGTTYNWRMSNKCDINGNSDWHNGPDFTTASMALQGRRNNAQKQNFIIKPADIKQYADDETADQVNPDILKVTPNPASSQINISLNTFKTGVASMMIKDLAGNVKWSASNVNVATLKNMTVNVSNFMPGIYSLQVICNDNSVISQKIIISR